MVATWFLAAVFSGANFFLFSQLYFRALPISGYDMLRLDEEFQIYCEVTIWEDNDVHTTTGGFRSCAQVVCSQVWF